MNKDNWVYKEYEYFKRFRLFSIRILRLYEIYMKNGRIYRDHIQSEFNISYENSKIKLDNLIDLGVLEIITINEDEWGSPINSKIIFTYEYSQALKIYENKRKESM